VEEQPTCEKGLAAHALLPQKLGELTNAVAEVLALHMEVLDLTDEKSRIEHAAYSELAARHQSIASEPSATAMQMADCRDLPMGSHDEGALADPRHLITFERFVRLEQELAALLQDRLIADRQMLSEMKDATLA
jgi:hypothetical protein